MSSQRSTTAKQSSVPAPSAPAMSQNVTDCRSEKIAPPPPAHYVLDPKELSQRQQLAIDLLLQGLSDAQVASQVGVDRMTIFRWRNKSPGFRKVLQARREALWHQSTQRLRAMIAPALDILQRQIVGDDPKAALRAAAILLRYASPARVNGAVRPDDDPQGQAFGDELEAYINAPLPGRFTAPNAAPRDVDDQDI